MKVWHDVLLSLIIFSMVPGGPHFPLMTIGRVAQRIRRLTTNQKIVGSNPIVIIFVESTTIQSEYLENSPLRVGFEPTREDPI